MASDAVPSALSPALEEPPAHREPPAVPAPALVTESPIPPVSPVAAAENTSDQSVEKQAKKSMRKIPGSGPWSRAERKATADGDDSQKQGGKKTGKKADVSETVLTAGQSGAAEEIRAWLDALPGYAGADTLLEFQVDGPGTIDLTQAHPSGLAQLLASRKTRLSTLIREPAQLHHALRAARVLRTHIHELGIDRGLDVGYLAAGTVSWGTSEGGQFRQITAPVMLTAVVLSARAGQGDYELQLDGQARLNPALVRLLRSQYGITLDSQAVARMAYNTARFDPAPVLDHLRTLISSVAGATVEHRLSVSSFADLGENLRDPALIEGSELLTTLFESRTGGAQQPQPVDPRRFPPLDERNPADEFFVLDADADQQLALDVVREGESVVVSAPPGTGLTQTALNAVATLVYEGKRVLVVGEQRAALNEFTERLGTLGLDSLVLQLNAQTGPQQLKKQLIRAITRNERAVEPRLGKLQEVVVGHRHQLVDHVASLHNVRPRWGCSPYQAMQSLAELTSIHPAPATTVRLKRSVLDAIRDRGELGERLKRAAELGSFDRSATGSPWYGARLVTRKETEEAHRLAEQLVRDLPALAASMTEVAEYSHIARGETFNRWGDQLELLVSMRESLDKFLPDIFDRPVNDLISATASNAWRRERGIEMASMQRSRLRRMAREYIRPGVHIDDLHYSLQRVQEQRQQWAALATSQRHPAVPSGLAELSQRYQSLGNKLAELGTFLSRTAEGGSLEDVPVDKLLTRLRALAADKTTLEHLPERTLLEDTLREHGLGELLDDLAAREVEPAQTRSELELAWWQSALEAMISGDEYLAMSDGDSLRTLEAEYRLADNAHIQSGSSRLRWKLAQSWREGIAQPRSAEFLRTTLKDGRLQLDALMRYAGPLMDSLVPVWALSPLMVSTLVPAEQRFDAVVILDGGSASLQSVLPALARSSQVVCFADTTGEPTTFTVGAQASSSASSPLRSGTPVVPLVSARDALARVAPTVRLRQLYRSLDEELSIQLNRDFYDGELRFLPDGTSVIGLDRRIHVEYLPDGTGLPGGDGEGVESVPAELTRVVDLVFESAREHPRSSLAVITASPRHAARVAEAVRLNLANHPDLAEFFAGGAEPFRVVPVDRASGVVRDRIIFSLGFGRTPHGRALHHFGALSLPGGRGKFALAMTRARQDLTVLSCFRPEDLDTAKLSLGARDFFNLLERELGGGATPVVHRPATRSAQDDPLVADLADRLRARDARVWYDYDGVIDVVAAPEPVRYLGVPDDEIPAPVAVESDGSQSYRVMSVRERSRRRPQLLEQRGWRYLPLWTIEVFTDPSGCADRISEHLGLDESLNSADLPSLFGAPQVSTQSWAQAPSQASARQPGSGSEAPARSAAESDKSMSQNPSAPSSSGNGHTSGSSAAGAPSRAGNADGSPASSSSASSAAGNSAGPSTAGSGSSRPAGLADRAEVRTQPGQVVQAEPVLPKRAAEDDPRAWGDREANDYDDWLRSQRPPHWG